MGRGGSREVSRSRERKKMGEGRYSEGPDGRWDRVQAKDDVWRQGVET